MPNENQPAEATLSSLEIVETIKLNGMPFDEAAVLKMEDGKDLWTKGVAENAGLKIRTKIRNRIKNNVADPESLLGTTADGAQLAVAALLVDVIALDNAKSFAEYKAARLALMGELVGNDRTTDEPVDVVALAQGVVGKIKTGEVRLTAVIKGVPAVLEEVMDRSTKVVAILSGLAE